MTKAERDQLLQLVRKREKVMKVKAQERVYASSSSDAALVLTDRPDFLGVIMPLRAVIPDHLPRWLPPYSGATAWPKAETDEAPRPEGAATPETAGDGQTPDIEAERLRAAGARVTIAGSGALNDEIARRMEGAGIPVERVTARRGRRGGAAGEAAAP